MPTKTSLANLKIEFKNTQLLDSIGRHSFDGENLLDYMAREAASRTKGGEDNRKIGIVVDVVDEDSKNEAIFDVVKHQNDNAQRIENASTNKTKTSFKTVYVHIYGSYTLKPDFKSIGVERHFTEAIEYNGDEALSVGSIVSITYLNKETLVSPKIQNVLSFMDLMVFGDKSENELSTKAVAADVAFCRLSKFKDGQGETIKSQWALNDKTKGGFYDIYEFLRRNIYDSDFMKNAILSVGPQSLKSALGGKVAKEIIGNPVVFAKGQVKTFFSTRPTSIKIVDFEEDEKLLGTRIELRHEDEVIKPDSDLAKIFSQYILKRIEKQFDVKVSVKGDIVLIDLDLDGGVVEYVNYSNARYASYQEFASHESTSQSQIEQNFAPPSTIKGKTEFEECLRKLDRQATEKYFDINGKEWKRQQDRVDVQLFFKDGAVNQTSLSLVSVEDGQVFPIQNDVEIEYGLEQEINTYDKSVLKRGISVKKVKKNIAKLRTFIDQLRNLIKETEKPDDIFIKHLSVFRAPPPVSSFKVGVDKNSQHFYGRAIDFVVYIKLEEKIYQIPPEIVHLYVLKLMSMDKEFVGGAALFRSGNTMYNHYESHAGVDVSGTPTRWTSLTGKDELETRLRPLGDEGKDNEILRYVVSTYSVGKKLPPKIRFLVL